MAYRYSRSACSSFPSAFFSMRDTFRRAYCKGFAVRNSFRLTEAELDDDLLVLCGNLKFVVPEEQEEIVALLKSKPWRILLGDETKRFDENAKKLVDKKWVSAYFVEQIDEEDFSR